MWRRKSLIFDNETDTFTYHSCKLEDDPDEKLDVHFQSVFGILEVAKQQGQGVLVHCQAGISRSASLVIAYLMRENKMTLREAFLLTKEKRPAVQPNSGFMEQLVELDKQLYGSVSFSIHDFYTVVLLDMGFPEGKAKRYLQQSNNIFHQALGLLLFDHTGVK